MFNIASKARPYLGAVVLTTALLTAGGIYSGLRMPSGVYPEVTFPRIAVVARVPGLSVPNMDVQVTQPLEQAVTTVIGVAQVRSKTIRGGSELSIDFNPGTDMRRAETMTWNRIGAVRSPGRRQYALPVRPGHRLARGLDQEHPAAPLARPRVPAGPASGTRPVHRRCRH